MADNILIKPATGGGTVSVRAKDVSGQLYSAIILADAAGNLYTPNALTQNVFVSTANSHTGSTTTYYEGTAETTLNCVGIQVNFEGDQHARITVYQSQDNSTWLIQDSFDYQKNGSFGTTVQATGSYVKVRATNLSSGTLTYKLQTVLCPIAEALPRALDSYGNLKVSTQDMVDRYGFHGQFSPFDDLKVCEPYRLVGTTFGSAADANFWTLTSNGTGSSATIATDIATLLSGTGAAGYGQITSVRSARFLSGHPIICRTNALVTNVAVANCTRRWGAFTVTGQTPVSGYYFELSAAGVLSVNATGADTPSVASGSFNGTVPEFVLDTNSHTYDIIYRNTKAYFIIDDVLVHTFGSTTSKLSAVPHLPVTATCINGSASAGGTIQIWSMAMIRLGRSTTAPTSKFQSGTTAGVVCKLGPGKVHNIVISAVANGSVVTLYDNTTATGTVLWASGTIVVGNNVNPGIININMPDGLTFFTGLSFAITTANCNLLVIYE